MSLKKDYEWKSKVDNLRLKLVDSLGRTSDKVVGGHASKQMINELEAGLKTLDNRIQEIAEYGGYDREYEVIENDDA